VLLAVQSATTAAPTTFAVLRLVWLSYKAGTNHILVEAITLFLLVVFSGDDNYVSRTGGGATTAVADMMLWILLNSSNPMLPP